MYFKLTSGFKHLLSCPICKSEKLIVSEEKIICTICGTVFPELAINTGAINEKYYDFLLKFPAYCKPAVINRWEEAQAEYIKYHNFNKSKDSYNRYQKEIDSVKEIYTEHFLLSGKILDIGGNQGRLRHFLNEEAISNYICTDPFPQVFKNINNQPNLLKAYPQLKEPVNFVASFAEHLPFNNALFDWVHMRSVLDHFYDPYLAIKEAYRVLKPGGKILIGLSIKTGEIPGRFSSSKKSFFKKLTEKIRTGEFKKLGMSIYKRIKKKLTPQNYRVKKDDHIFEWSYKNLIDLLQQTNFEIEKEHWQKPPYTKVIYISARKALLKQ